MQKTIPILVGGEAVGKATVKDDGQMTLKIHPSSTGELVWKKISDGTLKTITFGPSLIIHVMGD